MDSKAEDEDLEKIYEMLHDCVQVNGAPVETSILQQVRLLIQAITKGLTCQNRILSPAVTSRSFPVLRQTRNLLKIHVRT